MATAILIDGAYFIKRFRSLEPHNALDPKRAAEQAVRWSLAHLSQKVGRNKEIRIRSDLYRIFFYDCPPVEKKMHRAISKKSIDYSKSEEATFRLALHEQLRQKRKVALRLGHLSPDVTWTLKPEVIQQLLKKQITVDDLSDESTILNVRQKGVDMRIGIDITSIALKKQATQIVLIAGDADFVPAAKLARREGIDFVLDPMWKTVPMTLNEHVDGIRSTCPRPVKKETAAAMVAADVVAAAAKVVAVATVTTPIAEAPEH